MNELTKRLQEMDLDSLAQRAYENARKHGFHDGNKTVYHWLCLVICELSEAVEADRCGRRANVEAFDRVMKEPLAPFESFNPEQIYDYWFEQFIKDSVKDELADAAIRLLDLSGMSNCLLNMFFQKYINELTMDEYKPGWGFTEKIFHIEETVASSRFVSIPQVLCQIYYLADCLGFDLFEFIERKMTYNEHRPFMHEKEY